MGAKKTRWMVEKTSMGEGNNERVVQSGHISAPSKTGTLHGIPHNEAAHKHRDRHDRYANQNKPEGPSHPRSALILAHVECPHPGSLRSGSWDIMDMVCLHHPANKKQKRGTRDTQRNTESMEKKKTAQRGNKQSAPRRQTTK